MGENAKKWVNRVGIGMIVVGIIGVSATGGNPDAAVTLGSAAAVAVGALISLIKEIVQSIMK